MSKIPFDLQKYVKKQIIKHAAVFLLWEGMMIAILLILGKDLFGVGNPYVLGFMYALCLLMPFVNTNIVRLLRDKSYFGVIERAEIQTSFENERPWHPTLEGQYTATKVILTVKEEDSDKRHTVKVQEKGGAHEKKGMWDAYSQRPDGSFVQNSEMRYKVGAKVFHLRGTKHLVVLPEGNDQTVRCAVCGASNAVEHTICRKCRHTLVK